MQTRYKESDYDFFETVDALKGKAPEEKVEIIAKHFADLSTKHPAAQWTNFEGHPIVFQPHTVAGIIEQDQATNGVHPDDIPFKLRSNEIP